MDEQNRTDETHEEEPLPGDTPVAEEDFTDSQTAADHDEMDDAENDAPAQAPQPNLPPEQLPQEQADAQSEPSAEPAA